MGEVDTTALSTDISGSFQKILSGGFGAAIKTVAIALVLLVVCIIIKDLLIKGLNRGLEKSRIEKSLHAFLRSAAKILLWFITIMIVASSLGIDARSLIAILSIAGLAISLSVQNSLSNLAGGITILMTKPFAVGDYVEIGSIAGIVQEIDMAYTKLNTLDNRRVLIPNSTVVGSQVINYATESRRRVDLVFSASYDAPIEKVKEAILRVIEAHPKTLKDPVPLVRVQGYKDSSIEYVVRVWCENADYLDVYFDMMEQTKTAFDESGIEMTYPHVNVHMASR